MVCIEAIWPRPWECATGWVLGSQTTFTDFSIIFIIVIIMAIFMMIVSVVVVMIVTIGDDYKTFLYKVYILLKVKGVLLCIVLS